MVIDVSISHLKALISFFETYRETRFESDMIIATQMEVEPIFQEKRIIRRKKQFDGNANDEITHSVEEYFRVDYFLYVVDQALFSLKCHVAVKFAKALGVKVTVISASPAKKREAIERLGADSFLVSRDQDQMQTAMGTMDGIIDTVSAPHSILPLVSLLKTQGKLVMVGAPEKPLELPVFPLLLGRKIVGGSCIGGMKETQEMIDFAGKHNITADIEVIPMEYVNTAMERLGKADVRYRFVIDIANTLKDA
ncbi:probable mannitol dehydrogenase [Diospyros lotus]|uniref:probable mannitol dehydrogenase n=1 Tax=Diospyros lotus TaxID=55363 RepID=UPI00225228F1|nr:probable mannitol dehydrogenase [Diospyros lotus]